MFRIRQSYREDVDQVLAVAEHLDTVNLPAERDHIEKILALSEKSFAAEVPVIEREFLFVLEDLAKKNSKDPGSGENGGDLDFAAPGAYVPEFSQAMTKLKKGEMTEAPVKSQFGWHIIKRLK